MAGVIIKGANDAYVETGDDIPPNRLYEAVGFTEAYKGYIWQKYFNQT